MKNFIKYSIILIVYSNISGCSILGSKAVDSIIGGSKSKPILSVDTNVGDKGIKSGDFNNNIGKNSGIIKGGDSSFKLIGNDKKIEGSVKNDVDGDNIDTSGSNNVEINTIKDSHLFFLILIVISMVCGWFLDSPILLIRKLIAYRKGLQMKIIFIKRDIDKSY